MRQKKKNPARFFRRSGEAGDSLIEVVVSLFIIMLVLSIFSASLVSFGVNKSNQNRNLAYGFAEAELVALSDYQFDSLTVRTDGDFIGLAYNIGRQKIASDAGAVSPTQVQSVIPASTAVGGSVTSAALLPESYYKDFTLSSYFKVLPSSDPNWRAGIIFRYQDIENYYYWNFTSSSMQLTKVYAGAPTVLWTQSQTFSPGTWYKLKVVTLGTSLKVYLNDILKIDQADSSFSEGYIGSMGWNSTYYYLDSLHLESSVKNSDWTFDAEMVDAFPAGFLKISPAEITGLAGKLTVENYAGSDIKKVTAKVTWQEKGSSKEIRLSTLVSRVYD